MATRADRIKKLSSTIDDPMSNVDGFQLKYTQTKLGAGINYVLLDSKRDGTAVVESHVDGKGDPGFTFGSDMSELRTGPKLHVTTELKDIRFGNDKTVNPLAQFLPPNIVNFYQPMVPDLSDLAAISNALGGLSGL